MDVGSKNLDFVQMLRIKAQEIGFDLCRIASPHSIPHAPEQLSQWLKAGMHGEMTWMAERVGQRAVPTALWPHVRSLIILGLNYGPEDSPLALLSRPECGSISVYARHKDYHDVIKKKLKQLAHILIQETQGQVKIFVDTAPIMEKPLAQAAGIGWQGKHTNLVSRHFGSWLFLGAIWTDLDLPKDLPETDHCGSCRACLDICPTKAFPRPYLLDARRCLAYLSIEHKSPIPREFRKAMGNRIYGCDDCLAICPWNKFAQATREAAFKPREELNAPLLATFVSFEEADFRHFFSKSPVKRIGRNRFLRNVLIAIGNSQDDAASDHAKRRLLDPSPLVRGMAVWALSQLWSQKEFKALRAQHLPLESDPHVQEEWTSSIPI